MTRTWKIAIFVASIGGVGLLQFVWPTNPIGMCRAWSASQARSDARIAISKGDYLFKSIWITAGDSSADIPGVSHSGLAVFESKKPHPGYRVENIAKFHQWNGNSSIDPPCTNSMPGYAKAFNAKMLQEDLEYARKYGAIPGDKRILKPMPEGPYVLKAIGKTSWTPGLKLEPGVGVLLNVGEDGLVKSCRMTGRPIGSPFLPGDIPICDAVTRNARFSPMRLGDGMPIPWKVLADSTESGVWRYYPVD